MDRERLTYLYKQRQNQLATRHELDEWNSVLQNPDLKSLLDEVTDAAYYATPETELQEMDANRSSEIFNFIVSHKAHANQVARNLWLKVPVAAAAVALLVTGLILLTIRIKHEGDAATTVANKILPGKEDATLTLASGKRIHLGSASSGELAMEAGVRIRKTRDGRLVYEISDQTAADPGKVNTLTTARGETYMILLPDKSKVWLNAASKLIYPASFAGAAKRIVQLDGEAYFEVAKDQVHPFTVKSSGQAITVLGTHFDVNSYPDNDVVKTTLLEGRVVVRLNGSGPKSGAPSDSLVLKPDQQAIVANNSIHMLEVESSDAVAWKNGYFMFNNEKLGSIMQTLSRWYNTNIIYDDETLKNEVVFAKLSRYQNISKILRVMERTDKIKFKVEGNNITISRNQK